MWVYFILFTSFLSNFSSPLLFSFVLYSFHSTLMLCFSLSFCLIWTLSLPLPFVPSLLSLLHFLSFFPPHSFFHHFLTSLYSSQIWVDKTLFPQFKHNGKLLYIRKIRLSSAVKMRKTELRRSIIDKLPSERRNKTFKPSKHKAHPKNLLPFFPWKKWTASPLQIGYQSVYVQEKNHCLLLRTERKINKSRWRNTELSVRACGKYIYRCEVIVLRSMNDLAQAVRRRLLTAAKRIRAQDSPRRTCDGQSGPGFSPILRFSPVNNIPSAPHVYSCLGNG